MRYYFTHWAYGSNKLRAWGDFTVNVSHIGLMVHINWELEVILLLAICETTEGLACEVCATVSLMMACAVCGSQLSHVLSAVTWCNPSKVWW